MCERLKDTQSNDVEMDVAIAYAEFVAVFERYSVDPDKYRQDLIISAQNCNMKMYDLIIELCKYQNGETK